MRGVRFLSMALLVATAACVEEGETGEAGDTGSEVAATGSIYEHYIDLVYDKVDTSLDGKIQCDEFYTMIQKLELTEQYSRDQSDYFCHKADPDLLKDGVSRQELLEYIENVEGDSPEAQEAKLFGERVIQKLTGAAAAAEVTISLEVPEAMKAAKAIMTVQTTTSSNLDELLPGERTALETNLRNAIAPDLPADAVKTFFSAGSTVITSKFFFPDEAAAAVAEDNVATTMSSAADASALLGVPITVIPTVSQSTIEWTDELETTVPLGVGAATVLIVLLSCFVASCAAKARRKTLSSPSKGCCETGCCSAYALKGWAFAVLISVVVLLAGAALLYLEMDNTTDAIICIIETIITVAARGGDAGAAVSEIAEYLDLIDPVRDHLDKLNIAVILPAALSAALLVLGALCSCRSSKTMCLAKVFMLFSHAMLILCIVFYSIFAALALVIQVDEVQEELKIVTSLCESTQPTLQQVVNDLSRTLQIAQRPGSGVSASQITEYQLKLDEATPALQDFETVCTCINSLIAGFGDLFLPGVVSLCGAILAFIINHAMCWSAKCCFSPIVTGAKGNSQPQISNDEKISV